MSYGINYLQCIIRGKCKLPPMIFLSPSGYCCFPPFVFSLKSRVYPSCIYLFYLALTLGSLWSELGICNSSVMTVKGIK